MKKQTTILLLALSIILTWGTVSAADGDTTEITANANADSYSSSISADGNWVAFRSNANNLVPGDSSDAVEDIFLYNTQTEITTKVTPVGSNADSQHPSISADGTLITYNSLANNIVPGDDIDTDMDIFLYNRLTGITTKVNPANSEGWDPTISGDGLWVTYCSNSPIAGDANALADVFLYSTQNGATTKVTPDGSNDNSFGYPTISGDGRWITYSSKATNLVPGDSVDVFEDIFLYDRLSGITTKVTPVGSNDGSALPFVSADGKWITYGSTAFNIVAGDTLDIIADIFLYNRLTGVTVKITPLASNGHSSDPVISSDGNWIAYDSWANNIVAGDSADLKMDVFLYNRLTGVTVKITPLNPDDDSSGPSISGDGNLISYTSKAHIAGDTDSYIDVYLYNNPLVSDPPSSTSQGNSQTGNNGSTQVKATNTIGMQTTGAPLAPLAIAVLSVLVGLAATRKKQ